MTENRKASCYTASKKSSITLQKHRAILFIRYNYRGSQPAGLSALTKPQGTRSRAVTVGALARTRCASATPNRCGSLTAAEPGGALRPGSCRPRHLRRRKGGSASGTAISAAVRALLSAAEGEVQPQGQRAQSAGRARRGCEPPGPPQSRGRVPAQPEGRRASRARGGSAQPSAPRRIRDWH